MDGTMDNGKIKSLLGEFLSKNPNYDLLSNNCEALAKALSSRITGAPFPTLVKMRAAVYPVALGGMGENLVKITVDAGFEDALIYDPDASLAKGPGPFDIDDIIKGKK